MPNIAGWKNTAGRTKYPFTEACAEELRNGFLDIHVLTTAESTEVFLKTLQIEGNLILGAFWGQNTGKIIGNFIFDLSGTRDFCPIMTEDGVRCGIVLFNRDPSVFSGNTSRTFSPAESLVHPACVVPLVSRAVRSIQFPRGSVRGKVALIEGDGIFLVKLDPSTVRIDSIGNPSQKEACCGENAPPLRGINSAIPDQQGNINLDLYPFSEPSSSSDVVQMLRITPSLGAITISLAT